MLFHLGLQQRKEFHNRFVVSRNTEAFDYLKKTLVERGASVATIFNGK